MLDHKFNYTIILGPANAGKTEYFLGLQGQKTIVSCVKLNALSSDAVQLEKLQKCGFINTRDKNWKTVKTTDLCLVDEFHFFEDADTEILIDILNSNRPANLYFSLLTGTSDGRMFLPHMEILSSAADIVLIRGKCFYCGSPSTLSKCIKAYSCTKNVDKSAYVACCFTHFQNV